MRLIRLAFLFVVTFLAASSVRGGVAPYTEPGKIDFDDAIELLNPYGTWHKVGEKWAYTPLDHAVPYTNGRWLYSEYGWFWKGNAPHSWVTEHYGYWKRGADKVWSWYPGPFWLPQAVEIRSSPAGIGWRSAEVDDNGNFVESPADRFTKIDEWTFVTPQVFAGPITPAVLAKPAAAKEMLEESESSVHSYLTYREIDRPGPHPADFVNLGDTHMFPYMTDAEKAKALHPLIQASAKNTAAAAPTQASPASTAAVAKANAAKLAASLTGSTEMPEIPQQPGATDPNDDPRQVLYWITMCLPSSWAKAPPDAERDQIYIYRPDFYQDNDGINRRVALWIDPSLRSTEAIHLKDVLAHHSPVAVSSPNGSPSHPAPNLSAREFAPPDETTFTSSSTHTESAKAPAAATSTNAPAPDGRAAP